MAAITSQPSCHSKLFILLHCWTFQQHNRSPFFHTFQLYLEKTYVFHILKLISNRLFWLQGWRRVFLQIPVRIQTLKLIFLTLLLNCQDCTLIIWLQLQGKQKDNLVDIWSFGSQCLFRPCNFIKSVCFTFNYHF